VIRQAAERYEDETTTSMRICFILENEGIIKTLPEETLKRHITSNSHGKTYVVDFYL
jgi:hypothetical protein